MGENKKEAEYGLAQIQYMYRIEHCCDKAGLSFDGRKAKRRELTRPIMEAMKTWMERKASNTVPNR